MSRGYSLRNISAPQADESGSTAKFSQGVPARNHRASDYQRSGDTARDLEILESKYIRASKKISSLEETINNMNIGVIMFNAKAQIAVCNAQYMKMYDLDEAIVKPGCTLLDLIHHRR